MRRTSLQPRAGKGSQGHEVEGFYVGGKGLGRDVDVVMIDECIELDIWYGGRKSDA